MHMADREFWRRAGVRKFCDAGLVVGAALLVYWVGELYFTLDVRYLASFHEDDIWYYLNIARNFAHGRGFSYDGIEPTNGFHPLWMLVLALTGKVWTFEWISAELFKLQAIFFGCSIGLSAILLRRTTKWLAGSLFLIAWLGARPYYYKTGLTGLETPVFLAVGLLAILTYDWCVEDPTLARRLVLGLMMSVVFLARLDYGAFAFLVSVTAIWFSPKINGAQARFKHILPIAAGFLGPSLLYLASSYNKLACFFRCPGSLNG